MYLVVIHRWQNEDVVVAESVAAAFGILVFEARQKIAGGGPRVLATLADRQQSEALASRLTQDAVPAFVLDTDNVRKESPPLSVRRFALTAQALQVESASGEQRAVAYETIELLLLAHASAGQTVSTSTTTERKFSMGKTLMSGGMPMTSKVTTEHSVVSNERDETIRLYVRGGAPLSFDRGALNYDGLGAEKQMTRELNFNRLKTMLRQQAEQAQFDDRLLKQAELVRLLGPSLHPETDLDLAFKILSCSLLGSTH